MTHHLAALDDLAALDAVGGLGERCGASDRGQKRLEIFQCVLTRAPCTLRRWYS
jgi:hypothetical protein